MYKVYIFLAVYLLICSFWLTSKAFANILNELKNNSEGDAFGGKEVLRDSSSWCCSVDRNLVVPNTKPTDSVRLLSHFHSSHIHHSHLPLTPPNASTKSSIVHLMSQTSTQSDGPPSEVGALKRRLALLEAQNAELRKLPMEEKSVRLHLEGRVIRRLICLTERVEDLIAEFDRRVTLGIELDDDATVNDLEDDRRYRSYKKLATWCPSVRRLVHSVVEDSELSCIYSKLNKGAADDTTRLKVIIASWLMQDTPPPNPVIHGQSKMGRGFNNDATGRLICPVDYDWSDPVIQQGIRDYHPDYRVMAHSWPAFLYRDERYDPLNPTDGLFKGKLLLKTFKYIFTSPTSAELDDQEQTSPAMLSTQGPPKQRRTDGEHRTRCDVAGLLNMKSVQPRSIAYAAVQLRFALSSTGSWRIVDDEFNHQEFYDNIVDFLELAATSDAVKEVEDLLLWWNRKVFGHKHVSVYRPQRTEQLSVARCSSRR
ncbi:uncharacterized protein F5891DRAFT_1181512 [Suillus fuscotomentosus]|uniref:Uncharacterized protein n=1 Tax=Suillus fuscotomentosus TaxID=1912939 RepID=A0AAD4HRB0_9AGAM|nr:uncharacterized protein F5891DRAFT_1181512 [Suillus fuscotomentosus]KAG1907215.1 hypothetical protein F5891DRAFT_1181512 [Suillus fuscotomentosus]